MKLLFCGAANYSPVVLFIVLYKVVITFECVNEILWCDHSNEKLLRAVLSCGSVYRTVQGDSNFWVCGWKPVVWPFKHKLLSRVPSIVSFFWKMKFNFFSVLFRHIILLVRNIEEEKLMLELNGSDSNLLSDIVTHLSPSIWLKVNVQNISPELFTKSF